MNPNTDTAPRDGTQSYFGGTDTSEEVDFDWCRPLPELPERMGEAG